MPAQKLESFLSQFKLLTYKKRNIISRPDDIVLGIFCIKKGYVRVYSISRDGEELTLIIFKPGDFFPLHWVLNNTPNIYTLEAMTSVELWRVPKEQFVLFLKGSPRCAFRTDSTHFSKTWRVVRQNGTFSIW